MEFSAWRGVPFVMARSHTHTDLEFNLVLRGTMRYFVGGRLHTLEQGDLIVFWAGCRTSLCTCSRAPNVSGLWCR
jgi:uncharacterized cupin superfamily protein